MSADIGSTGGDAKRVADRRSILASWPTWIPYVAAGWSFAYAVLGVVWALGGPGFPFGRGHDPSAGLSILAGLRPGAGGTAIAVVCAVAGLVALAMAGGAGRGVARGVALAFAGILAVVLTVLVPDYRPLLAVGYAPIILIGEPFGWPPDVSLRDVFPWPVVNQLVCIAGGVAWAASAIVYRRRGRGACPWCGRSDDDAWTAPASAARWGRWATAVAVAVPLTYAATRFAWALGIPLGISRAFLREGQATGLWWAGAALATLAVAGALLTIGLVQPWGVTFPSWIPFLGSRRVPPALAIVPSSIVSLLVTTAGVMFIRIVVTGAFTDLFSFGEEVGWMALAPELLWPVWGVALAAATLAYHLRRRGRCARCGRS